MQVKPGVRVSGLKPEALFAMLIVESAHPTLTITAVVDGTHKPGSLHYNGLAFDFRTHDLSPAQRDDLILSIRAQLGPDFDVLLEDAGTPNEHGHVEHQPKNPL